MIDVLRFCDCDSGEVCGFGRRGGAEVIGGSREVSVRDLLLACRKFVVCESLKESGKESGKGKLVP